MYYMYKLQVLHYIPGVQVQLHRKNNHNNTLLCYVLDYLVLHTGSDWVCDETDLVLTVTLARPAPCLVRILVENGWS